MLIVKWPDSICKNPVVPSVLPALVVNSVAKAVAWLLARLYIHNLGLVQHIHVEAEDLFILLELRRLLLTRGSHDGRDVVVAKAFDKGDVLARKVLPTMKPQEIYQKTPDTLGKRRQEIQSTGERAVRRLYN